MEYYILLCYQKAKKNCQDVEQGFDRYEPRIKKIIIACLILMILACVELIVSILLFHSQLWCLIGVIFFSAGLFALLKADNWDKKEHSDKYVGLQKKKLEILESVLMKEFDIKTEEKLNELINIYQEYVDKKKEEEKRRNGVILTSFSAAASILVISFENMGLIGIDLPNWMYLAAFLLVSVTAANIWIYLGTYLGSMKRKYEMMIKDIKGLLLIKF